MFAMMAASAQQAKQLLLPPKLDEDRGDWKLQNDFIGMLQDKNLGFASGCEKTVGKQFVRTDCGVLYQLLVDERIARFKNRSLELPSWFAPLLDKRYNDPTKHRHGKLTSLQSAELEGMCADLLEVQSLPFMQAKVWREGRAAVASLAKVLQQYLMYLQASSARMNALHESKEPARTA
eukprot:scpid84929/ scgid27381/ 